MVVSFERKADIGLMSKMTFSNPPRDCAVCTKSKNKTLRAVNRLRLNLPIGKFYRMRWGGSQF